MPPDPLVLTVEEAGAMLRIGRSAAYDAARRGEIPTIRLGRSLRVPRSRLAELLGESPQNDGDPATHGVAERVGDGDARDGA